MLSLKVLFSQEGELYDLLERSAWEAQRNVELLDRYLRARTGIIGPLLDLDDFELARRNNRQRARRITAMLAQTGATLPFGGEEIEALSYALQGITRLAEKLVERLSVYPRSLPEEIVQRQSPPLKDAVEAVGLMVGQLREQWNLETIQTCQDRIQAAEGDADRALLTDLQELNRKAHDPWELVILKQVHETIAEAIDRCRDAGNAVHRIVLAHA
jgi:hypothetical protein